MPLYTIGVYGFDARSFFGKLQTAGVDILLDIRRRRAVRGSHYAFANARRLSGRLDELGIAYRPVLDLAPDDETRAIIYEADRAARRRASERTELSRRYIKQYTARTLKRFDFDALAQELRVFQAPCLLCVEGEPNACHRSLVAPALAAALARTRVVHLKAD